MKNIILTGFVLIALGVSAHNNDNASITYSHVGGSVYNIVLNLTRDCRSLPISGTHDLEIYSGSLRKKLKAARTSFREITFNSARMCWPSNTTASAGWEEHVYEVKVDLDTLGGGSFSPICKVWFSFSECCRSGALTNMQAGNYYMEAMLDKCNAPGNSGPVFAFTSAKNCQLNQTAYHNLMAYDSTDGDILVYELVTPMTLQNSVSTYVGTLSNRYPFRTYCQDGSVDCKPAPFSSPTRGLYHDSLNGNNIFTPVTLRDYAAVAYKVKEYRYIDGVKTLIGTTMAEYVVQVIPYHRPMPKLTKSSQKLAYRAKAGDTIRISFATELADTIPDDSVRIWVVNPIKNSVVTVNDKWRSDGTFIWAPGCSDVRKEPYFFIVNFYNEDDSFTRNFQSYAYNIYVDPDLNLGPDTLICRNTNRVLSTPLKGKYVWNGNPADSMDNYIAKGPGKYFLELERNGCKLTDTVTLTEMASLPEVYIGKDTLLCDQPDNQPLTIFTQYQPHVIYDWNVTPGYPYSTLIFSGSGRVILSAENVCGFAYDTIEVRRLNSPVFSLPEDTTLCSPVNILLKPDRLEGNWDLTWSNSSSDSAIQVSAPGLWWLKAENDCGALTDSVYLYELDKPDIELGNDTMVCFSQFPDLNVESPFIDQYFWSTGQNTPVIKPRDSGLYTIRVINRCGEDTDSIYLKTVNLPVFDLGASQRFCPPFSVTLSAYSPYSAASWSTGDSVPVIHVTNPGTYTATLTNICGSYTDSVRIDEIPVPTVNLGNDTIMEKPFSLILNAGDGPFAYKWNTGPADTFPQLHVTEYGTYSVRVYNECGEATDTVLVEAPEVGIEGIRSFRVRIFPNPFRDQLRIEYPESIMFIRVSNLKGQLLYESFDVQDTSCMLDTRNWSSGIYVLTMMGEKGSMSFILSKE